MRSFDITGFEDAVVTLLKTANVSANVYTNRPKSTERHTDFITVRVGSNVEDMDAYADCRLYITLYAKDVDNMKNGKKLSVMYEKLVNTMVAELSNRYMIDINPTTMSDTADDYGFHARVLIFNATIKIQ